MIMDGWQTANYLDDIMCKHETEWCKNHVYCIACSYYKINNFTTKEHKTNADRIRSMTDEELAYSNYIPCPYNDDSCGECKFGWHERKQTCEECKLEWLRTTIKKQ